MRLLLFRYQHKPGTPFSPGPGQWALIGDVGPNQPTIVCAKCKQRAQLDHAIAANGDVSPSVVCPRGGCDWHVLLRLHGWTFGDVAHA